MVGFKIMVRLVFKDLMEYDGWFLDDNSICL